MTILHLQQLNLKGGDKEESNMDNLTNFMKYVCESVKKINRPIKRLLEKQIGRKNRKLVGIIYILDYILNNINKTMPML